MKSNSGDSSSRNRYGSNTSETLSVSSFGSSDTQSLRGSATGDDSSKVSSPAATTLRPRFGKEYSRVDRKKLVEELSLSDSSPAPATGGNGTGMVTQQSPSTASSVFTFDVASMASSRTSFLSDSYSTDNDSPKSPSVLSRVSATREAPDHVYMNICFPNARSGSPLIVDTRPGSALSGISSNAEQSNALLNYAEIDLSGSGGEEGSKRVGKGRRADNHRVEYAMIDMVATAAASRVGKEHAKQREDSLRRKDHFRRAESEGWRKGKDRKSGQAMNGRDRKSSATKNSSSSSSAKDRKFSSPM